MLRETRQNRVLFRVLLCLAATVKPTPVMTFARTAPSLAPALALSSRATKPAGTPVVSGSARSTHLTASRRPAAPYQKDPEP